MKYLILSLVLLLLSFLGFLKPIREVFFFAFSRAGRPIERISYNIKDTSTFLFNIRSIYNQNQALKHQLLEDKSKLAALSVILLENQSLRNQFLHSSQSLPKNLLQNQNSDFFNSSPNSLESNSPPFSAEVASSPNATSRPFPLSNSNFQEMPLVLVNILGNPQDFTHSTIYISSGTDLGVKEGDLLIYENNLLGKVKKTSKKTSLVELIFSPDLKIAVRTVNPKTAETLSQGLVSGAFGTSVKLERVLQKDPLRTNDIIVTSGKEGLFLKGLLVGRVGEVYAVPTQPLKSAQVVPLVDLENLSHAFVLKLADLGTEYGFDSH